MLRYSLIYGAIAGIVIIATMGLGLALDSGGGGFSSSVVFGYLVMLVVLSLIFIGIKRYRDIEQGGVIGFGKALLLGLGIAVIAGIAYVVSWEAYLAATDHAFINQYSESAIAAIRAEGLAQAETERRIAEVETMRAQYGNPLFRLPMTFLEIFPVGLLVSLVSAALLRNPRFLPARAAT